MARHFRRDGGPAVYVPTVTQPGGNALQLQLGLGSGEDGYMR